MTAFYLSNFANCVFNAFLCYTAFMLNSVTIYAIKKTSSLPKNLKTLLLSLAVSDLGVGLIVHPLYIAVLVIGLRTNFENDPTYKAMIIALFIPLNLFCYASFFGVTALTVDRFLAIHLHLRYNELVTHKRVVAAVISVWLLSAFLFLVRFLIPAMNIRFVIYLTIEVVCLIATAALYCKIYSSVRRHTNQIHTLQVQQEAQNGEMANALILRKSAITTFYVYLVFLVCYFPNICIYVVIIISGPSTTTQGLQDYVLTLMLLNSSLNPLIYCWKMRHTRHAIMDILRQMLPSHN